MHVEEIMNNYNPVYPSGGTWADTRKYMQNSPYDSKIVQQLMEDLAKYGEFREPITLSTYEEYLEDWADEIEAGEDVPPYSPYVKNGTHRVIAHSLSQNKEAKVQMGWFPDGDKPEETSMYPLIASRVFLPLGLDDDFYDDFFASFRSFKLTEEIWMTSGVMSNCYGMASLYWDEGLEEVAELKDYISLLHAKVREILTELGQTDFTVDTVILHSEEEDDAFFSESIAKLVSDNRIEREKLVG